MSLVALARGAESRVCELAGLELAFAAFTVDAARLRLLVVSS
jgi:hypothetical protein